MIDLGLKLVIDDEGLDSNSVLGDFIVFDEKSKIKLEYTFLDSWLSELYDS